MLTAAKVTIARAINKADRPVTARNRDLKGVPASTSLLGLRVGCEVSGAVSMVSPGVVSFSFVEFRQSSVLRQFSKQTPHLSRGYARQRAGRVQIPCHWNFLREFRGLRAFRTPYCTIMEPSWGHVRQS